jgi:DNA-binding MarR family transcriptional regulator
LSVPDLNDVRHFPSGNPLSLGKRTGSLRSASDNGFPVVTPSPRRGRGRQNSNRNKQLRRAGAERSAMANSEIELEALLLLWRFAVTSRAHVDAIFDDLIERTYAQFGVLRTLATAERPYTPAEIARELKCSKTNAANIIRRLERYGQVVRQIDGRDARWHSLALTPRGENAYAMCEEQLAVDAKSLLAALDGNDKEQLLAILRKLLARQ